MISHYEYYLYLWFVDNTYNTQHNTELTGIALANVEALANDIDYFVPQKNNNPQQCELYLDANGVIHYDKNTIGAGITYCQVPGIENFCESPKKYETVTGCDPYNCHQRVK